MARLLHRLQRLTVLGLLALLACTLATLAARTGKWPELLTHFRHLYLFCAAAAALVLAVRSPLRLRRAALALAVALAVWNGAPVAALYLPGAGDTPPGGREICVVFANLQASAGIGDEQLAAIVARDPDLIGFAEVSLDAPQVFDAWLADWPERLVVPQEDDFGIALFSKHPLVDPRVVDLAGGAPTLTAEVLCGDAPPFRFVVTHPPPPLGQSERHRRHLEHLGRMARDAELPLLIVGDLNATPFSPRFTDLLDIGGLTHARAGLGLLPSWGPDRLPGPFRLLPIDHVLVKGPWVVEAFLVQPNGPSDHDMIIAELRFVSSSESTR